MTPYVDWAQHWGNVAQWIAAFGTSGAVIYALWREQILAYCRRPKLSVTISTQPPDSSMAIWKNGEFSWRRYHYRLRVTNNGKTRAERVQIFVEQLTKLAQDGEFHPVSEFLPMNLLWTHTRKGFAESISPDMYQHCDLGYITEPNALVALGEDHEDVPQGQTPFILEVEFKPYTKIHFLPPGTYRLKLKIGGANFSSRPETLEIKVTGNWYDKPERISRDGVGLRLI